VLEDWTRANLALWNELTGIHERSDYYDVAGFLAGKNTLFATERDEIGPEVAGKTLLHLQCHFGLDTLSLARMGATVTGVDFSDEAIAAARRIADQAGIAATFVQSDVAALPDTLQGSFDIVFTSWGVLVWLPDLERWAQVIAHFLAPGGVFYIAEFHPFAYVLAEDASAGDLRLGYPYFHDPEPLAISEVSGSYADRDATVRQPVQYEWQHTLGDVVSALTAAGLTIDYLHEFPFMEGALDWPCIVKGPDGRGRLKGMETTFPLSFTLHARR